ncbi:hypothetical protein HYN69_20325 (plasmid) [Gemmobacter aquarius]|uniref:Uncharacterized protein n=1 Tax=Paragemmobacter aquarius TaxID=2169400 RepID=A0A2S0USZ1_9RHOB|nr:hypothetical protein [Gemmobacter aquarius]AWB50927.1 hypothetical protein HYN69_20325 [Gemmobacter aquarius]
MPALGPATLALSDAELRETLDLHSRVIARMSDKIDEQGALQLKLIDTVIGGMDAILDAARAAKQQTDPARYARHIEQELDKTIGRVLDRLDFQHSNFEADRRDTAYRLEELVQQEENVLQRLRTDQERAGRWKKRIPFIAFFGLVLALGLAIVLPRILANSGSGCGVIGGAWTRSTTEAEVCVFYSR